ncbi:AAA family ATPase [Pseudomonas graminis]|uniref:AAA family ATPase n=1 Tax=Pseudomonas graminis TaxID=158627 RepID=UPI00234B3D62|nr:AAA family ATPase [Pseudomonas graminis]MDC6379876.1 AAA family ATPase [Pseudomonas graminis]
MALVDDLLAWSLELKDWQRDALRRLFTQEALSPEDLKSIASMVKEAHGGGPASAERPLPLSKDHVAGIGSGATVQLLGVSSLTNINGFPTGRAVEFQTKGLTVLFGENGVGKSGYARLLKNTCRARRRDNVRSNAFGVAGVPTADVSFLVNGSPTKTTWTQGGATNADLSMVSVYDAACAMDYVEQEGSPAFLPYGLGQLNRLVAAQKDLQRIIANERDAIELDPNVFAPLRGDTDVGRVITTLGVATDIDKLRVLANLTEADTARLAELALVLQDSNPEPKASALDRQSERLLAAVQRVTAIQAMISDDAMRSLNRLYAENEEAQHAYQEAQERLRGDGGGTLPGTGNALWKILLEAAQQFSERDAYPAHRFPHTDAGAKCVLCQTILEPDAQERMRNFTAFIEEHAAANAGLAKKAVEVGLKALADTDLTVLDVPTLAELTAAHPELNDRLLAFSTVWQSRKSWVKAAVDTADWSAPVPALPEGEGLGEWLNYKITANSLAAKTLRQSDDPTHRAKLNSEHKELKARESLALLLPQAEKYVQHSVARGNLEKCLPALVPTGISTKMTNLSRQYVTSALAESMTAELTQLGYRKDIVPELSGRTAAGATKVTLKIKDSSLDARYVLSEGEQRAIALALFLAEVRSIPHTSTVIFDDPSTSLDHRYRRKMAKRLLSLAAERQVIVLTHDAVFLTELHNAQRDDVSPNSYKSVCWDNAPGKVIDGLTWETMTSKMRLEEITKLAKAIREDASPYLNDGSTQQIANAYGKLRGTIERAVREEFMNNTIQPFSNVVSVEAFGAVIGHPQKEWDELISIYDRACEAIEAHDTPAQHQLPIPTPDQLLSDVEKTINLIGEAAKRRKAFEKIRSDRNAARKKPFMTV